MVSVRSKRNIDDEIALMILARGQKERMQNLFEQQEGKLQGRYNIQTNTPPPPLLQNSSRI